VLAVRDARALLGASAVSQIGNWLYNAALLGYVYQATGSTGWVGAATICRLVPFVLFEPAGGAVADWFQRRRVLIVGNLLQMGLMLSFVVVVIIKGSVWAMLTIAALASIAGAAERPTELALLPRLVGESRLGAANALMRTVLNLGTVVGPAIGALVLAIGPGWLAFAVNAATFAAAATIISLIRDRSRPRRVRASAAAHMAQGLQAARRTPFVVPIFLAVAMVEFTYGAQTVQLVAYANNSLGLGSGGYGVMLAALGVGGVLSFVISARLVASRHVSLVIVATSLTVCAVQLVYAATQLRVIAISFAVISGIALVSCEVVGETTLARTVRADAIGRVMGVFDAGAVGAMVAGAVLAPLVITMTDLKSSFIILGIASMATALLSRLGMRGLDEAINRRADELASRITLIERLPFIAGASPLVVERLAASAQLCQIPAGIDVVALGAPAHALFVIVEGSAVVHRSGRTVVQLGAGSPFGERGLIDRARRNATVTTQTECTLLRISGDAVLEALAAAPGMQPILDAVNAPARDATDQAGAPVPPPVDVTNATVLVVGAGYGSKRRIYERILELGARIVIVDEPGHWSEQLVADGIAESWLGAPVTGDPDRDAQAVLDALARAAIRPDGVLTFWEDSVPVAARVAAVLSLPGNPVEAVDAARSKLRTREMSERLGLPTPRAARVRSLDELYAAAAEAGFPAVVKPEFGASAMGCVRVDSFTSLPDIYRTVRSVVSEETDAIFRAGNGLLLEEYLDGVEFDVDLVLEGGECVFSSVSQNWATHEPSFQETGLHCPPDHRRRPVRRLVDFCVKAAQAFGFETGVLHIEAKATTLGPRIVEINARMGGGPIHRIVEAVWGVDLVEAQLRSSLGLAQNLSPSRRPRCAVADAFVYPATSGRLVANPVAAEAADRDDVLALDPYAEIGAEVAGLDEVFATAIVQVAVSGQDLRDARARLAELLREPVEVEPLGLRMPAA
jgi:carnosine synthase